MSDNFTNLLPFSRQRALIREYRFRLGVTFVALFSMLILAATILLIPTYVFLSSSASTKTIHLVDIKSTHSPDEIVLSKRLDALSRDAATILSISNGPSASKIVNSALSVSRPGIMLSAFGYALGSGKNKSTLTISGSAATREALRGYQLALQGMPFALAASLPVSAYAKDTNIDFTITVTLAP